MTLSCVILEGEALNTIHNLKEKSRGAEREKCLMEEQQQIDIHPFSTEISSTLFTSDAEAQEPERYHTSSGWD